MDEWINDWVIEQYGVRLYNRDIEVLHGSFNRSVRINQDEDMLVHILYMKYMGMKTN
jgi:hypothetical protein